MIIKACQCIYDTKAFELAVIPKKMPYTAIIKRFQIDYSLEQKYKLGIMTPEEYGQWLVIEHEKALEEARKKESEKAGNSATFWGNDRTVRRNVSDDDFDKFLKDNNLDVTNDTHVDVGAIIQKQNDEMLSSIGYTTAQDSISEIMESADEEKTLQDIMAANAGDDANRVLTTEEIAALFAAMGTN